MSCKYKTDGGPCDVGPPYYTLSDASSQSDADRVEYCARHYPMIVARSQSFADAAVPDVDARIEAMFGKRYRTATFDTYETDPKVLKERFGGVTKGYTPDVIATMNKAKAAAQAFVDSVLKTGKGTLLLFGPEGSGKTHLEVAAVRELVAARRTVAVRSVPILVENIRTTYGSGSPGYMQDSVKTIIERVLRADVAVLEDMQASAFKDDIRNNLYRIIDGMYVAEKAMIMTTNIPINELRLPDRMGAHLIDRMIEPPSWAVELAAPSWRVNEQRLSKGATTDTLPPRIERAPSVRRPSSPRR